MRQGSDPFERCSGPRTHVTDRLGHFHQGTESVRATLCPVDPHLVAALFYFLTSCQNRDLAIVCAVLACTEAVVGAAGWPS